jgi:hypothetical protein
MMIVPVGRAGRMGVGSGVIFRSVCSIGSGPRESVAWCDSENFFPLDLLVADWLRGAGVVCGAAVCLRVWQSRN